MKLHTSHYNHLILLQSKECLGFHQINIKTSVHWYKPKEFIRKHQSEHIPTEFSAEVKTGQDLQVHAWQMTCLITPKPEHAFITSIFKSISWNKNIFTDTVGSAEDWETVLLMDERRRRVQCGPEPSVSARINKTKRGATQSCDLWFFLLLLLCLLLFLLFYFSDQRLDFFGLQNL